MKGHYNLKVEKFNIVGFLTHHLKVSLDLANASFNCWLLNCTAVLSIQAPNFSKILLGKSHQ